MIHQVLGHRGALEEVSFERCVAQNLLQFLEEAVIT
jgi:hypothetical protein